MASPKCAIVVPTLGQRPEFLEKSLESIRAAGQCHLVMVAPSSFDATPLLKSGLIDVKLDEVGTSLPAAINQGFGSLPSEIEFISWLGDDDVLGPNAIQIAEEFLVAHPRTSLVYGRCDYIDEVGNVVWTNKSGRWAAPVLRVGPDLIPQPGSMFRRDSFERVGGLRTDLGWAFDLDLFIKLSKHGKLSYVRKTLAAFRWHADSLSVGQRADSVREASQVRRENLPAWLRPVSLLWEGPVRLATYRAGGFVGRGSQ
ncbi:MAG TPA: hypothetical protein PJ998_04750 [Terrimesophilobacter sp.]|nr:hypothetical protein [Terrimesophilobacter sp.]